MRALALLLLLAACGRPGCADALRAELFFGGIDEADFSDFLDRSVTPRFPAGLTTFGASGRWRGPDGTQLREASRVVILVVPARPDPRPALDAVREDYERRFAQQTVGLVLNPVEATGFELRDGCASSR